MMTKNDIEDLLKKLPAEKPGKDFTAQLMTRISNLPAPQPERLSKLIVISICGGVLGLIIGACRISDHFFGWTQLYVKPTLNSITEIFSTIFSNNSHVEYSPIIFEGLLAGVVLLLIDAAIRRRLAMKN